MPHLNIKHFPVEISPEKEAALLSSLTKALQEGLGCSEGAVSIALEPVPQSDWQTAVYQPEIEGKSHLLRKLPNY